jgi:hypothetical protein
VSQATLHRPKFSPEEPARLTVGVVGTSRSIAAGLSQMNLTSFRRGSVLSRLLAPAQLVAVNGYLGGIASALALVLQKGLTHGCQDV